MQENTTAIVTALNPYLAYLRIQPLAWTDSPSDDFGEGSLLWIRDVIRIGQGFAVHRPIRHHGHRGISSHLI